MESDSALRLATRELTRSFATDAGPLVALRDGQIADENRLGAADLLRPFARLVATEA